MACRNLPGRHRVRGRWMDWLGDMGDSNRSYGTVVIGCSAIEARGMDRDAIGEFECPMCKYSLEGLPQSHHCPECSYLYTKPFAVFHRSVAVWQWLTLANLITFAAGIVLVLAKGKFTFWLLTGIGFVAALLRGFSAVRKVIITHDEVQIVVGSEITRRVPMALVGKCSWDRVDGSIRFLNYKGGEIDAIPRGFLWSHRKSMALVEEVNAFLADGRRSRNLSGASDDRTLHVVQS